MKTVLLLLASCLAGAAYSAIEHAIAFTATNPSYTTYTVTDPAAFGALGLPLPAKSIVLRNGLVLTAGIDYTVGSGNSTFTVAGGTGQGDHITVVTFQ